MRPPPIGEASERKGRYIAADPYPGEQAGQAIDGASQCWVLRGGDEPAGLLREPLGQIRVLEKQRHSSPKGCRDALLQKKKKRGRESSALATAASSPSPVQGRRTPWTFLTPPHSLGQGAGRPQPQKQLLLAMQRQPQGLGHDPGEAAAVIVRALSSCALRTPTPARGWACSRLCPLHTIVWRSIWGRRDLDEG